ncbi:hypothetical protein AZ22_1283 [Bordetella bronchiseptica 980-2]|nr:hypothetical protein AZ22_1283 [Bordetella bronchiseptica 980-2]
MIGTGLRPPFRQRTMQRRHPRLRLQLALTLGPIQDWQPGRFI